MNLEQLRAKRNELADKTAAVAELEAQGTDLTDEQAAEFEQADAEFKKLDEKVRRVERAQQTKFRLKEPRPSAGAMPVVDDPGGATPVASALPGGPEAKRQFECFEEFLASALRANRGEASDPRLEWGTITPQATQRMGVGSEGGFMVPAEFRA